MFRNPLSWYIFTFSLFELIIKTHLTLHDSSHGFISKNTRYFDDDFSNIHEEITSLRTSRMSEVSSRLQLKFEPTFLDFKQRPLGVPHLEKVTLFNIDKNKSIDMTSISGSTVHFHSSFFEDKRIPPNGNTSFNVVFLGREEGFVESSLFIHTSEGFLKYNVKGASTFSHYRLRPIVGIKLPLNSTFAPLIYMHNPHSEPIQIVEIYSSGGDFHLELPTGEQEGPNDMWEIPPLHTKAVIRVRFQARVVQNHTAYVRIKLNKPDEVLVVPLEVEVTSVMGVFHPQGSVDFGIGGKVDPPKEVKLCLYNPLKRHVRVHSVSTPSKAIKVQYYNVRLPPESEMGDRDSCVEVATLTVDWKTAYEMKEYSGKIIVKYRNGKNRSEIPYHLTVLKGGISYDPLTTTYFINDRVVDLSPRSFKVKNDFDLHLKIIDVKFPQDAHLYFKIETLFPKVLKPGQEANIFNIKLKSNIRLSDLQLHSQIILKTNISNISVPLLSYNGKLQVHLPFKSKDYSLDIGLIGFDSRKEVYFMIVNRNPITIQLKNVHSSIPMTQVEVHGCGSGDYRLVLFQVSFPNLTKCHNIKSNNYAMVKVVVTTSHLEGQVWGDIFIETQFENLDVPVHFKIASGKLEIGPDRLVFDQCFPAKICSHPLRVHSTYNDPMIIEDIVTLPPDKRISSKHTGHILARTSKVIGHLFLNPDIECQTDCYTGLQSDTSAQWLKTFVLTNFVADFDIHLINIFYNRYLNLTSNGSRKWQNITLRLDTSEVRGHIFKTRVKMSWPSLIVDHNTENRSVFVFPLTQIGNYTYQNITIRNPASYNVVVQMVFDRDYPNVQMLYNGLPANLVHKNVQQYVLSNGFFFDVDTKEKQLDFFWQMLGVRVNRNTMPVLLYPGQSFSVHIGFHTYDTNIHSAFLFLRNNLTIMEVVQLRAQGALPSFKFGNRKPGSLQPLTFDMTDKHLRDCERQKQYASAPPNLTVKRTFTARNIGDVTVYVHSFHINDMLCEGYGFKVIDCEPFALPPNGTKKIDIAFTPDLTLTKITRTLILDTSLNILVNYTLHTTIPSAYLNLCADLITRPAWEIHLSYVTLTFMFMLNIIIVCMAVIDADRIKKQAMGSFVSPSSPSVQPILDLRLVGQHTREEIQSTKNEAVVEEEKEEKEVKCEIVPEEVQDEVKTKLETERYTVLIPATGKTKKKLGKRNSNDHNLENADMQVQEKPDKKRDKLCEIKQRIKEKREEKEYIKIEEKDKRHLQTNIQKDKELKKQPLFQNKKHTKNTIVPAYEEETSSTTTDSSCSNNEDPEKENNQRKQKVCSKIKLTATKSDNLKTTIEENPNHIFELKSTNFNPGNQNKVKYQKCATKLTKMNEKHNKDQEGRKVTEHHNHNKHHSNIRDVKKREKSCRDRKEKNMFHKKNADKNKYLERQVRASESDGVEKRKSPSSFYIPLPTPTTTSSVWGESRAKFSDVVARNESSVGSTSCTNRPLVHTSKQPINKPTMYVEPYKQTSPAELGPIGSKRSDHRLSSDSNRRSLNDENHRLLEDSFRTLNDSNSRSLGEINHSNDENSYARMNNLLHDSSNSFFSNVDEIHLDNSCKEGNYLEEFASISGGWNQQQDLSGLMESDIPKEQLKSSNEDLWGQNLLNTNSYWSGFNGPLLGETLTANDTMPLLADNAQQRGSSSQSAGYLWGSSSVWQPWAPETPRTPTRTPPGFDEFLQRKREEEPQPPRESYSPFNIWTQQQTNPWNYSQGQ